MRKFFNRYRIAAAVILILFLLSILMVVLIHINPGYLHMFPAGNSFMILEPESVEERVIDDYTGVQRIYTVTLPESVFPGTQIRFYLRHTYATFYLDDSSRADKPAELNTFHIGHTPGHYWMAIPVHHSLAGEKLHIVLTPVYASVMNEEPVFYFIDRDTLLTRIVFPKDRFMLVLSIVTSAAGVFLILFSLTPNLSGDSRRNLFYMGAATICAGIWKLCSLPIFLLLIDYLGIHKEIWYAGVLAYIMMLVLSLRLQISLRSDKGNRVTRLCFYISAVTALLLVTLQLADCIEIHSVLVWYGISMAFLHLISLFGKKPTRAEILWLLPFFITLGLDFLICLITGTLRGAPFFLLWMLVNLFIRGFGFLKDDIDHERQLRFKEVELKESRIRAMMSEIRPHFIHNTLTSIYMLCSEDPERAQKVVADFSNYLQANFSAISSTELTSFNKELEHTKAYVAVESILYEGKLTIDYHTEYTAFRLPPLTLQPIVENAIKYSVGYGRPKSHITVRTGLEGDNVIITVEDDGIGFSGPGKGDDESVHVGLNNVRERLEMMCDGQLTITPGKTGGSVVTITIPVKRD